MLVTACPAIAISFAGQVGMLDVIRTFFLFIQKLASSIQYLSAFPLRAVLGRAALGHKRRQLVGLERLR